MYDTYEYDTAKYRSLLEKWSPKLHPNHFQVLFILKSGSRWWVCSVVVLRFANWFSFCQVLLLKKRLAISMNGTLSFDQVEKSLSWTYLRPSINDLHYQHQLFPKHKDKSLLLQNVFLSDPWENRSPRGVPWEVWTGGPRAHKVTSPFYDHFCIPIHPSITIFATIIP